VISIVDSGIDDFAAPHPDLAPNVAALGYDAVDGDSVPTDAGAFRGHGTSTAGIAAAAGNGAGIAGVAYCSTLQIVRVLDCSLGSTCPGTVDDVAEGIEWAGLNGADVINLSLASPFYSQAMRNAVLDAIAGGAIVVAASGNDGLAAIAFPANYPEVIAVGASDSTGGVWSGSNWGPNLDVVAPGHRVLAPFPNAFGYATNSGTSLASPFVAGVAALLRSRNPGITHLEAKDWINDHARATTDPAKDGSGEVFHPGLADFSDTPIAPVGHGNSLWEWLGTEVTPESGPADPADFDGRPNFDGLDPGHGDGGDDGVFPMSFPKLPFAPDRWDGPDLVDVSMTVSDHGGPRYGAAADRMLYVDQFIDWNMDGAYSAAPSKEHSIAAHAENPGTWGGDQKVATLPIAVATEHILGLPLTVRTRLGYGAAPGLAGDAKYGEVEDVRFDNFVEDFDTAFYSAALPAPFPAMGAWAIVADPDPGTGAANHGTWEWARAPHPHPGDECNGALETVDPMGLPPMDWSEYTDASVTFHYNHNSQQCGPVGLDLCRMEVFVGGSSVLSSPIPPGSGTLTVGLSAYTGGPDLVSVAFVSETDDQGWLYVDDVRVVAFDEHKAETITGLSVTRPAGTRSITASWTAPHENELEPAKEGVADQYQVRYSDQPITSNLDFFNAVPVVRAEDVPGAFPLPAAPGTPQSVTFDVPSAHESYFVAVRTGDEVVNDTVVSNAPLESTPATDGVTVTALLGTGAVVVASPGDSVEAQFRIDNTGNAEDLYVTECDGTLQGWPGYVAESGTDRPSPVGLVVPAGGSTTLTCGIHVPVAAADSTQEMLVVTAASTNGAAADLDFVTVLVLSAPVDAPATGGGALPAVAALDFAGPNPSRGRAAFRLALPRPQSVRVDLFDVAGRRVVTILDRRMDAGFHDVRWDGTDQAGRVTPSGIYFLRTRSDDIRDTKRVVRTR
jgi:hypothetical protein